MTNENDIPNLPEAFLGQLAGQLGAALPDFLSAMAQPPLRGIRFRRNAGLIDSLLDPIPWAERAWYLPLDSTAGAEPLHEAGAYYIQEPSAMIPAGVLCPEAGDRVLDLCAAPGGKSTQLGAMLNGTGLLVSNEPVPSRAQILSRNIERMGISNAVVVSAYPENLSSLWQGFFDKILVDAPCSGEGMFRRHPETRLEWDADAPTRCAERQTHILHHAAIMLRPGGKMVYSTCTFNPIENEQVITRFLADHPDFSLVSFALPGLPASDGMLHIWPHEVRGEGHFVACLQKQDGVQAKEKPAALPALSKQEAALTHAFLQEQGIAADSAFTLFSGHVCALPGILPKLDKIKVLRLGLQVGDIRGKVLAPDHALALACRMQKTVMLDETQARLYQAGEALPCEEALRGWCVPVYRGMQLGWVKASDGMMKNHYPKGLRIAYTRK